MGSDQQRASDRGTSTVRYGQTVPGITKNLQAVREHIGDLASLVGVEGPGVAHAAVCYRKLALHSLDLAIEGVKAPGGVVPYHESAVESDGEHERARRPLQDRLRVRWQSR